MEKDVPVQDHLAELRRRLLTVLLPMALLLPALYIAAPGFLARLFSPLAAVGCTLHVYHVTDGLSLRIRSALLMDTALCAPLIAVQAARFAWPGLYRGERRALLCICSCGVLFGAAVWAFTTAATPALVRLWYARRGPYGAMLSAVACYNLWSRCAVACGLAASLPPALLALLWTRKQRKG